MATQLSLEWHDRLIRCCAATDGAVTHAFTVELPAGEDAPSEADLASHITAALAARGISKATATLIVGRANVELRQLKLPPAPAEELPDIVRFQAMRQFTSLGEDWPLDFVPLAAAEGASTHVLAAAVAPELVSRVRRVCEEAPLRLDRLGLRSLSAAMLLIHSAEAERDRVRIAIDVADDETDLTVVRGATPVLVRTVRASDKEPHAALATRLAGELKRTVAAAQNQLGGQRVESAVLFGGGDRQPLCDELLGRLNIPIELVDPFLASGGAAPAAAKVEARGPYAALLGALVASSHEAAGVNFLAPRRKPKEVGLKRRLALPVAAAAAVILALVVGIVWSLGARDQRAAELAGELRELDSQLRQLKPDLEAAEQLDDWSRRQINLLDELVYLSKRMPPAEAALVTALRGGSLPARTRDSQDEVIARMRIEGLARDSANIAQLENSLRDDRHRVPTQGGKPVEGDGPYRLKYGHTIELKAADEAEPPKVTRQTGGDSRQPASAEHTRAAPPANPPA